MNSNKKYLKKLKHVKKQSRKNRRINQEKTSEKITVSLEGGTVLKFDNRDEYLLYKDDIKNGKNPASSRQPGIIPYPPNHSEFEIQSYLFSELKQMGLNVRGEVTAKTPEGGICRFDLVIYSKDNRPLTIIEVKSDGSKPDKYQNETYLSFGLKLRIIIGIKEAHKYIIKVKGNLKRRPLL